jgi:peroxiredoxin
VEFGKSDERAVAVFEERLATHRHNVMLASGVNATFLTTLGDYRYLTGGMTADGSHLNLSCFDGAHAFLFKAELKPNGTLEGDFWSGDSWHETWSAVRDDNAKLPDPFGLTKWNESARLDSFWFRDLDGKKCLLSEFPGKARMLVAFGSWCPNCNDEAEYLRELDEKYRARGLSIVGLAFELTGDFARDSKQVQIYAERHKLAFPLLIAGTSDKEAASKKFPLLDKIRAFPTTIFLHSDGRVRAVHQGYSGPATGAEHTKLREDFERLIDEVLAESDKQK